jgi:hypothetical protein
MKNLFLRFAIAVGASTLCVATSAAQSPGGNACQYEDKAFSEGASICPQRHLMLRCSLESGRPVWTVVQDNALARRCLSPMWRASTFLPKPRRAASMAQPSIPQSAVTPGPAPGAAPGSAKCFSFNGKRYCE